MQKIIISSICGGIATLTGKILFDWIKNKRNNNNGNGNGNKSAIFKILRNTETKVDEVKNVVVKTDGNGLPLMYAPREWKKTLDILNERTLITNTLLERTVKCLEDNGRKLDNINK